LLLLNFLGCINLLLIKLGGFGLGSNRGGTLLISQWSPKWILEYNKNY
jgi:hypothetical protein